MFKQVLVLGGWALLFLLAPRGYAPQYAKAEPLAAPVSRASPRRGATPRWVRRTPRAVLLARMAWVEAGAHVTGHEVAALHEVIVNRRPERASWHSTAWGYSVGLRNPRRRSIHRLGRGELVGGWPAYWVRHWPRVLGLADAAIAGDISHECEGGRLMHWGGAEVDADSIARLERRGFSRADCPEDVRNVFLVRGGGE